MIEIVLASFWIKNKLKRVQFFQKTFFATNTNMVVILGIFFLTLNNADILFAEEKFL